MNMDDPTQTPGDAPEPTPRYAGGFGTAEPSGPRATFGQRFGAWLIDGIIVGAVVLILWAILRVPGYVIGVLLGFAYYVYMEAGPAGQTVGKRAMGIRVIRLDTRGPLGWGTSLLRHLVRTFISSLLFGLGYWWMLWDREKQTWHDKIARTVVVPVSAYPPPPNSFGQSP